MTRGVRLRAIHPRSLRGRLILGATALAAAAVISAQVIGIQVLRSWLLNQVDEQLAAFPVPTDAASAGFASPAEGPRTPATALPSDFRVIIYAALGGRTATVGGGPSPGPRLPDTITGLHLADHRPTTVAAVSGDGRWRVQRNTGTDGTVFVVCLPLNTLDGATTRLLWLNLIVLTATVIALVIVSRWVVRLGLRPLTRMANTARHITASDLGTRIHDTNPATETGRLGAVLNTMLERLQSALRDREASEERLRRFVADAGHELRTPLTTIHGFAQLALRHESQPAERREADHLIALNAERMTLLVNDLLLLAHLGQEPTYDRQPVELMELAAEVISAASAQNASRPVRLGPLAGNDRLERVHVLGDPHRLRQVAANLLMNALVHSTVDTAIDVRVGATVSGTAAGIDRPGRTSALPALDAGIPVAVLEVADHGPGLNEVDAARVFERFFRADPARSRENGGSGLGLAIATTIAYGHAGRLELDYRPGPGCVFRLVLPVLVHRADDVP